VKPESFGWSLALMIDLLAPKVNGQRRRMSRCRPESRGRASVSSSGAPGTAGQGSGGDKPSSNGRFGTRTERAGHDRTRVGRHPARASRVCSDRRGQAAVGSGGWPRGS